MGMDEAAAAQLLGGARCSSKTECKSGRCLNPNKCDCTKNSCTCTCACSTTDPMVRCTNPNPCKKVTCTSTGRCVYKPKCADTDPCTQNLCDNGDCSHPPVTNGKDCGGGKVCQDGVCCDPGFADCDGDGDCEVDIRTDVTHCGRCATACGTGATCVHGACTPGDASCPEGCDGNGYVRAGGLPGGICAANGKCNSSSCEEDNDCPVGSACLAECGSGEPPHCSAPCGPGVD